MTGLAMHICLFGMQFLQAEACPFGRVVQCTDCLVICRTHKVLFPSNTVMNLLQDLVLREPRLAALTTNYLPATTAAPGQSSLLSYCLSPALRPSTFVLFMYQLSIMPSLCGCHVVDGPVIDSQSMQIHQ